MAGGNRQILGPSRLSSGSQNGGFRSFPGAGPARLSGGAGGAGGFRTFLGFGPCRFSAGAAVAVAGGGGASGKARNPDGLSQDERDVLEIFSILARIN